MGRPHHHHYHRHWQHGPVVPQGPAALMVSLCGMATLSIGVILVVVALAGILVMGPVMALFLGAVLIATTRRRRRWLTSLARPAPVADPLRRPTAARPAAARSADWATNRERFARLQRDYARFECDPLAVLHTPALADVTVPSTARFVEAFAEAQALATDTEPPPEHRSRFIAAVEAAVRAWAAARDAADRIRLACIPEAERATVQRAIKLLTVARDATHDAERAAAYTKARAELAKLDRSGTLRLPRPAAAALEAASRGQLPGSSHPPGG